MRRKQTLAFDDYLFRRCDELHQIGGDVDLSMVNATTRGDPVILDARIGYPDEVELEVFEFVERTSTGGAHRVKFRYQGRWQERLLVRFERDPIGHPEMPGHKHMIAADGTETRVAWTTTVTPTSASVDMWHEYNLLKSRLEPGDELATRTA